MNAVYIGNFSVRGELQLYQIRPIDLNGDRAKMQIHRSNLDNTWFDNVDFSGFKPVSFYRTKFSKTIFTSCRMPVDYISFDDFKALENVHYPEKKRESYDKDRYEMFLQLRKAFEGTGNYYESQKMQSIAHDALKEVETVSAWDRTILRINSFSNNHGLSIKQPFIWLIVTSVFLYLLYLWSLGRLFNGNGWDLKLFGYYFQFLDLTHRLDFLAEKDELTGWAVTLDFLNKLFAGFFIYQFIAAFRKYGKT